MWPTEVFTTQLIEAVKKRPALWNPQNYNYNDTTILKVLWNQVSTELAVSDDICKSKWRNVRDMYKRLLKKKETSGSKLEPNWNYFKSLSFLKDVTDISQMNDEDESIDSYFIQEDCMPISDGEENIIIKTEPGINEDFKSSYDESSIQQEIDESVIVKTEPGINFIEYVEEPVTATPVENENLGAILEPAAKKVKIHETQKVVAPPSTPKVVAPSSTPKMVTILRKVPKEIALASNRVTPIVITEANSRVIPKVIGEASPRETPKPVAAGNQSLNKKKDTDNSDYYFLMSLLPHVKRIPLHRKLHIRNQILKALVEETELAKTINIE